MRTTTIDESRRERREEFTNITGILSQQLQQRFAVTLSQFQRSTLASDAPLQGLLEANFFPSAGELLANPANIATRPLDFSELRKSDLRLAPSGEKHSLASLKIEGGVVSPGERGAKFQDIVQEASRTYGVPVALVNAVIRQESAFNPEAVSHCGAMGLMQLMPATAEAYGCGNPFDVRQNVMAGTRFLSDLLKMYKGDVELALAGYNAGPGNVAKYGNQVPPFRETRDYVVKVQRYYEENTTEMDRGGARFAAKDTTNS